MDERLAHLRARFIARCRAELAIIEADDISDQDLQHMAHRAAGMAGTVGLKELGIAAAHLEDALLRGDQIAAARLAFLGVLRKITSDN
ncbi:Hpt domain-containing protein [Sphingobium xenophagum]|nr:Hpt domain-containing protein [Sphingobium xenophagum]